MTGSAITSAFVIGAYLTASATGQTLMPVTATWELSIDNGATWSSGTVSVPEAQASVRARYILTWGLNPSHQDFFNTAVFSPLVTSIDGAGLEDTVSNIRGVRLTMGPMPANVQGRRWRADEIKIGIDASPPPSGGVILNGFDGIAEIYYFGNPVSVLEYDLALDGTAGERRISAAWRTVDNRPSNPYFFSVQSSTPGPWTYAYTFNNATLVVVPSPAGLAVLGVASGALLRRRRGM